MIICIYFISLMATKKWLSYKIFVATFDEGIFFIGIFYSSVFVIYRSISFSLNLLVNFPNAPAKLFLHFIVFRIVYVFILFSHLFNLCLKNLTQLFIFFIIFLREKFKWRQQYPWVIQSHDFYHLINILFVIWYLIFYSLFSKIK